SAGRQPASISGAKSASAPVNGLTAATTSVFLVDEEPPLPLHATSVTASPADRSRKRNRRDFIETSLCRSGRFYCLPRRDFPNSRSSITSCQGELGGLMGPRSDLGKRPSFR